MSVVLLLSIVIRLTAGVWAVVLLRRVRDWRMAFLSAMLALMALRQVLTLTKRLGPDAGWSLKLGADLSELPGLVVSILAALAVYFLEDMLLSRRKIEVALRENEERLLQAQKMEAIGTLAGGVAHDFNNLLTAIGGHTELAREDIGTEHPADSSLREVGKAVERASDLTRQLLGFARPRFVHKTQVDPKEIILELMPTLRRMVAEDIEFVVLVEGSTGHVEIDRTQFEQVLINLVVNARDAMPDGGKLTIALSDETDRQGLSGGAKNTQYLVMSISDTGVGIPLEIRDRLFEPFFTSKPSGKGTGLGLFTCYGIVNQSGGHIRVDSDPGQPTRFEVRYPALPPTARVASKPPRPKTVGGHETILLAEDEPQVRAAVRGMLERQGYVVVQAADGAEAKRAAESHGSAVDLLLTDMVMPQLGGRELAKQLRDWFPDLCVVYMSGYPQAGPEADPLVPGSVLLSKPFTSDQLLQTVRRLLDGRQGQPQSVVPSEQPRATTRHRP